MLGSTSRTGRDPVTVRVHVNEGVATDGGGARANRARRVWGRGAAHGERQLAPVAAGLATTSAGADA